MYVCCLEHLELAIDHFVDEMEEAPDVYNLGEIRCKEWEPPETCQFCTHIPSLLVV